MSETGVSSEAETAVAQVWPITPEYIMSGSSVPPKTVIKFQKIRQRRVLSCVHCHSKKIRCDRDPIGCISCRNANLECVYYANQCKSRSKKVALASIDGARASLVGTDPKFLIIPLSGQGEGETRSSYRPSQYSNTIDIPGTSFALSGSRTVALRSCATSPAGIGKMLNLPTQAHSKVRITEVSPDSLPVLYPDSTSTGNHKLQGLFPADTNLVPSSNLAPRQAFDFASPSPLQFGHTIRDIFGSDSLRHAQAYTEPSSAGISCPSTPPESFLDELFTFCPRTRTRSRELIDRYIKSMHLLIPVIVDMETFLPQHESFCASAYPKDTQDVPFTRSTSLPFDYIGFFSLYFPLLLASTLAEFEEYDNLLLIEDIYRFRVAFNKVRDYHQYPNGPKIVSLLVGSILIEATSPNASWEELVNIIEYAKALQLHRDPLVDLGITDVMIVRYRRALWFMVFALDAWAAKNYCVLPKLSHSSATVLMMDEFEMKNGIEVLNIHILFFNIKCRFDRIMNIIVYNNFRTREMNGYEPEVIHDIKMQISNLFDVTQQKLKLMKDMHQRGPPMSLSEMNFALFVKTHVGSYVDRLLINLHTKLVRTELKQRTAEMSTELGANPGVVTGHLAHSLRLLSELLIEEEHYNIMVYLLIPPRCILPRDILKTFSYENLDNNLVPAVLHSLADFLAYNDFINFGRYNWFIKRLIPIDGIVFMYLFIAVKLKHQMFLYAELELYATMVNKAVYLVNRNWFKNEKCRRMICLFNMVWEVLLKRFAIFETINCYNASKGKRAACVAPIGMFGRQQYQMDANDMFSGVFSPTPVSHAEYGRSRTSDPIQGLSERNDTQGNLIPEMKSDQFPPVPRFSHLNHELQAELTVICRKFDFEIDDNFLDPKDYCPLFIKYERSLYVIMSFVKQNFIESY